MKILLLSNSTMAGQSFLSWPKSYLKDFFAGVDEAIFIPYAAVNVHYSTYLRKVNAAFLDLGIRVISIDTINDKVNAILESQCIVVGGGNTFCLLNKLHKFDLLKAIRSAVQSGSKYLGWSAGSNIASPTIKTTNDMPIVQPQSFEALDLVGYQINPHFTHESIPSHGGESRVQRINEFLALNQNDVVVGLPEGSSIMIKDNQHVVNGKAGAYVFEINSKVQSCPDGSNLLELINRPQGNPV